MNVESFFLAFNMKNFGYFKLLREYSIYLNSSFRYCRLHILRARKLVNYEACFDFVVVV